MYYVYMMRCEDRSIYTGITTDVRRRLTEHQKASGKGARYTRSRKVTEVLAVWQCADRSKASRLEYAIKTLTKIRKEQLVTDGDLSVCKDRIDTEDYRKISEQAQSDGEQG